MIVIFNTEPEKFYLEQIILANGLTEITRFFKLD